MIDPLEIPTKTMMRKKGYIDDYADWDDYFKAAIQMIEIKINEIITTLNKNETIR